MADCGNGEYIESNDCYASGGLLPLTGTVNGECTPESCTGPDHYDEFGPLVVTETGLYAVSATWQGRADLDLYILDSDASTILARGEATSDSPPEVLEVMLSANQEFYIAIFAWNSYGSTISYTVTEEAPGGG
jgi:hypothetical protein